MKGFLIGIGVIIAIALTIVLAFGLEYGSIKWAGFFNPMKEDVRRETFESTRSFNEGKKQELAKYRFEYITSKDESEKAAIASTVRIAFADYDAKKLPVELYDFWMTCNNIK